jgi:hypothetical protein
MTLQFFGTPNQKYSTRQGTSYTADANGMVTVTNPTNHDIQDLQVFGLIPVASLAAGALLGKLIGANMNVTTDQPLVLSALANQQSFRVTKITVKNASANMSSAGNHNAAGGIYPAVSKGGTLIVLATQAYTALAAPNLALDLTIDTVPATTVYAPATPLIFSLTTALGAACTADIYALGDVYN